MTTVTSLQSATSQAKRQTSSSKHYVFAPPLGVYDRAGPAKRSRWRVWPCCLPLKAQCRRPGGSVFAAQYPAYAHPGQCFTKTLAGSSDRVPDGGVRAASIWRSPADLALVSRQKSSLRLALRALRFPFFAPCLAFAEDAKLALYPWRGSASRAHHKRFPGQIIPWYSLAAARGFELLVPP